MEIKEFIEKFNGISGVYKISIKNRKSIIGSSIDIGYRISNAYLCGCKHNKCHNKEFQKDFNLLGESSLNCELLEEIRNSKDLLRKEYEYINKSFNLYNVSKLRKLIINDNLIKRYWDKVIIKDGCWDWNGFKEDKYPRIEDKGYRIAIHRVSYFIHYGNFDESLFVCHICDNKICSNPKHLFLGSPTENQIDRGNKGRGCKLTKEMVDDVRKQYLNGITTDLKLIEYIRNQYNIQVTEHTISAILLNKTKYDSNWIVPIREKSKRRNKINKEKK